MIEKIILKMVSGSNLYGTNTENSDKDFLGIFLPTKDFVFGLKRIEDYTEGSLHSKDEKGKNTKDAVDINLYELRKFIRLALGCNPNIIEMLFVNDKNIIETSDIFKILRENKNKFLSKEHIISKFIGYATAQEKKMVLKLSNYNLYKEFEKQYNFLTSNNLNIKDEFIISLIEKNILDGLNLQIEKSCVKFADTHFQKHYTFYNCYKIVKERLSKVGNREELVLKYGYDTKFASHYIRLLEEGIELLETGNLIFPLKNADFILDIKLGKLKIEDIIELGEEYKNKLREIEKNSKIKIKQDYNFIENLVIEIFENYYSNA